MLAYPITLEDDDGTLLATSPAGPTAVNQPVGFRKGRSARQALLSTSAQDPRAAVT